MAKLRILYVSSEIAPFLESNQVSDYVRQLPELMQNRDMEIRILVPKFGSINERKNRLHEVVRLSGINITVGEEEKPLIIKVASIPAAKLQVYFIDNDDYFNRKSALVDKEGNEYADNEERAIFFCKGVLETVRKLGWSPDIVHCNDWMSSLIPMYLKTAFKKDPNYKDVKTLFSVFNTPFKTKFSRDIIAKAKMAEVNDSHLELLSSADYDGFMKIGMEYSDVVLKAEPTYDENHLELLKPYSSKTFEYNPVLENPDYYLNIYQELTKESELAVK